MEFINGIKMDITLEPDERGKEQVVILAGAARMKLTAQQALMLATKLVMAANRLEAHDERRHQGDLSTGFPA